MEETDAERVDTRAGTERTVLVVADERAVADLYAAWLESDHEVRTAAGHDTDPEVGDDVDVLVLDRELPGESGKGLLGRVRESGLDCRVVMITGVKSDDQVVDMPVDHYLSKPVSAGKLDDIVGDTQGREEDTGTVQEYFALTSKKAKLEAENTPAELLAHDEYQEIAQRVEKLAE